MISEIIEILLLTLTVFFEASGENIDSKIGHAWVIKNRVDSKLFANTYYDVIFHPKHFSCYNPSEIDKHIKRLNDTETIIKCFTISYNVYYQKIKDNTNGALWYTAVYEYKDGVKIELYRTWMKNLKVNVVHDNTKFMGLKDDR